MIDDVHKQNIAILHYQHMAVNPQLISKQQIWPPLNKATVATLSICLYRTAVFWFLLLPGGEQKGNESPYKAQWRATKVPTRHSGGLRATNERFTGHQIHHVTAIDRLYTGAPRHRRALFTILLVAPEAGSSVPGKDNRLSSDPPLCNIPPADDSAPGISAARWPVGRKTAGGTKYCLAKIQTKLTVLTVLTAVTVEWTAGWWQELVMYTNHSMSHTAVTVHHIQLSQSSPTAVTVHHIQVWQSVTYSCHSPSPTVVTVHQPQLSQSVTYSCHSPSPTAVTVHHLQLSQSITYRCDNPSPTAETVHHIQLSQSITNSCHSPSHTIVSNHLQLSQSITYSCHCPSHTAVTVHQSQLSQPINHSCHSPSHTSVTIHHIQLSQSITYSY